ncbi:MAG: hypothetical protein HW405_505 [Candidatus Berkelbacteria bacterium]|nr:hypothetical protein [Candidatus Berkelbacteria bacterium]
MRGNYQVGTTGHDALIANASSREALSRESAKLSIALELKEIGGCATINLWTIWK